MTPNRIRKELRDQGAHILAGVAVLELARLAGADFTIAAAALVTFALGMVRELTEEGEISLAALRAALGSRLDLACWALAGLVDGLAWQMARLL